MSRPAYFILCLCGRLLQWTAVVAGTSHRVDRTLYLGLVREGESRWVVNEVRLLR
jgi:hypothetical protein